MRILLMTAVLGSRVRPMPAMPVFRYALERWHSDPFQLVVFHQGQLNGALEAELKKLEADPNPDSRKVTPNWQIVRIDTTKDVPKLWQAVWQPSAKAIAAHGGAVRAPSGVWARSRCGPARSTTEVLHELGALAEAGGDRQAVARGQGGDSAGH